MQGNYCGGAFPLPIITVVCVTVALLYAKRRTHTGRAKRQRRYKLLVEKDIEKRLNANRIALENFVKALAEYLIMQSEAEYPEIIKGLALSISFCPRKKYLDAIVLKVVSQTELFKNEMKRLHEIRIVLPPDAKQTSNETELLLNVHEKATDLIHSRNILAMALCSYKYPRYWQFSQQFFVGAYLHERHFEYADFSGALLIGTELESCTLAEANFDQAVLFAADMTKADLTNTVFTNANLKNAKLTKANLKGADLTGAKVAWSTLHLAKNVGESWQYADYTGEKKRDSKLWRRMKAKFGTVEP